MRKTLQLLSIALVSFGLLSSIAISQDIPKSFKGLELKGINSFREMSYEGRKLMVGINADYIFRVHKVFVVAKGSRDLKQNSADERIAQNSIRAEARKNLCKKNKHPGIVQISYNDGWYFAGVRCTKTFQPDL